MAETTITRDEVAHVAGLAKLAFNDADLDQFTTQLGDILNIFDTLSEVNTCLLYTSDAADDLTTV